MFNSSSDNNFATGKREWAINSGWRKSGVIGKSCHLAESCVHIEQCPYYLFSAVATEATTWQIFDGRDRSSHRRTKFRRFWLTSTNSANRIRGVRVRGL